MPSTTPSAERLTASDRPGVAQPVPERHVPNRAWPPVLLGALLIMATLIGAWEWHWRAYGAVPGILDNQGLWATQRRRIDNGEGDRTVLIGSSRTFFDVQLPVWEQLSGRRPIQLGLIGTSPVAILEDLADDEHFTGQLLVGIAPDLFFSGYQFKAGMPRYYHRESPSQRVGQYLSMHFVEPYFAFLDSDYALFTVIERQPWPERPGKRSFLHVRKLSVTEADRNNHMWSKVETDAEYAALARRIWAQNFSPPVLKPEEIKENREMGDKEIERTAVAVAKLRARGVPVIFVREPSSGEYLADEERSFPRAVAWDPLLAKTGAPGIHFLDYPEMQHYEIPEWSHLSHASALQYTADLYRILEREHPLPAGRRW